MLPTVGTVPTTKAAIYTVPTGTRARITRISVDNETAANRTIKLYVTVNTVESGFSETKSLFDGQLYSFDGEFWLAEGNTIMAEADATGCTFFISGQEII